MTLVNMVSKTSLIRDKIEAKKEKRRKQWADSKKKLYKPRNRVVQETVNEDSLRRRKYRAKQKNDYEAKKTRQRLYTKNFRERQKALNILETPGQCHGHHFENRMAKSRSIKKIRQALPCTPVKRASVLSAYLDRKRMSRSPAVNAFHRNAARLSNSDTSLETDALENMKTFLQSVKRRRSDEARTALSVIKSSVCSETDERSGVSANLAKKLGINPAAIKGGIKSRSRILHSEESAFTYTKRKTRSDALTTEVKHSVFEFWLRSDNSRPGNNKNDVKRVRLEANIFSSHTSHILEKTQTKLYQQFTKGNPDIKLGQRAFEKCKPYYVRSATAKDKVTCCCRQHLEARSLFRTCTAYQKKVLSDKRCQNIKVYDSLADLINDTLCAPSANTHQQKLSCLNRECSECGVQNVPLLPYDFDQKNDIMNWERCEYKDVNVKMDKKIRKLVLTQKSTSPKEMFEYFTEILHTFACHHFRASWQAKQLKTLSENLPQDHCVTVHDFSENYKCWENHEIQSSYFQKMEVTLHVTVIHRHSVLEIDGVDSSEDNPNIVTEHFLVISPDQTHDHHFTRTVQKLISDYLKSINCTVRVMHEFTDGCASQYKSRHCIGDLSYSCEELGYDRLIRIFFETSHGRGSHDAAGGFVKRQTDLAILRSNLKVQSAEDVYTFARHKLSHTAETARCKRRIFRYVDNIDRQTDRYFKPVKDTRKIHQVNVVCKGMVTTRQISCYSCDACVNAKYDECENYNIAGDLRMVKMSKSKVPSGEESCEVDEDQITDFVFPGVIVAVKTEDKSYPYYLLKATTTPVVVKKNETDVWGAAFRRGSFVIRGFYFDHIPDCDNALQYRLLSRLPAIVPAHSVTYICSEVYVSNNTVTLTDTLHRRILKSLEGL